MSNKDKIILHLCAKMGSDSLPYKEAGYDVRIIGEEIGVENYNPPDNVYGIIANPPCAMFSMARTRAKIPRDLKQGMFLVKECLRIIWECQYRINPEIRVHRISPVKFWMLENPSTGCLKWFLGNPVFQYCQSEYGSNLTKRTGLWGMFKLPIRPILFNALPKGYKIGSKHEKTNHSTSTRSKCPYSFAKAFLRLINKKDHQ